MKILSVESSCDETAVAVVEDGRTILTDCIASQVALHRLYGGVVPELASRKHIEAIYALADTALDEAHLTRQDIDAIAVTYAPGLIGAQGYYEYCSGKRAGQDLNAYATMSLENG